MKVKELIKALGKLDPELPVFIRDYPDDDNAYGITEAFYCVVNRPNDVDRVSSGQLRTTRKKANAVMLGRGE